MRRKKISKIFKSPFQSNKLESKTENYAIQTKLTKSLNENLAIFEEILEDCSDVVFREFTIGTNKKIHAMIIWMDGLVDRASINDDIMNSLMQDARSLEPNRDLGLQGFFLLIRDSLITADQRSK